MWKWLDGKKTYIAGFATAGYGLAITFNLVASNVHVWEIIGGIGIIGVRGVATKLINAYGK